MQPNFAKSLPHILVYEGGKVDNPRDPGGRTNKGITQATFNAYRRGRSEAPFDVYGITDAEVADIYKTRYWDAIRGDDLPAGLDLAVFDAAVNSGPKQAGEWLQHALGSSMVDGQIGPHTLQAVTFVCRLHGVPALIDAVCDRRLHTLQQLHTWATFGHGWASRIANVRQAAKQGAH